MKSYPGSVLAFGLMAAVVTALTPNAAWCQDKGRFELGFDVGATYRFADPQWQSSDYIQVTAPEPRLRAGYFLTDRVEIEQSIGWIVTYVNERGDHNTQVSDIQIYEIAQLVSFRSGPSSPYVRFGVMLRPGTAMSLGGGMRIGMGEDRSMRIQFTVGREQRRPLGWDASASLGLSLLR